MEGKLDGEMKIFKLYVSKRLGDISKTTETRLSLISKPEIVEMLIQRLDEVETWSKLFDILD